MFVINWLTAEIFFLQCFTNVYIYIQQSCVSYMLLITGICIFIVWLFIKCTFSNVFYVKNPWKYGIWWFNIYHLYMYYMYIVMLIVLIYFFIMCGEDFKNENHRNYLPVIVCFVIFRWDQLPWNGSWSSYSWCKKVMHIYGKPMCMLLAGQHFDRVILGCKNIFTIHPNGSTKCTMFILMQSECFNCKDLTNWIVSMIVLNFPLKQFFYYCLQLWWWRIWSS